MNAQQKRDRAQSLRMNRSQQRIVLPTKTKLRKYPIWSVKTITILSLLLTAVVAAVVFFFGKESILVEAERISVIVAGALFLFLWIGLYHGIRVRKNEPAPASFEFIDTDSSLPDLGGGWFDGIDGDLPALILAPILFLLLGLLLVFLLPIVVNLLWLLLFVFVVMLFWVFRYALRQVFVRSRATRGRLGTSLYYASVYTAIYSGWVLVVLITARHFAG
jgi:hypothetical protein